MKDFKRTDDLDLEIKNGDFVIAESDQQHVEDIFIAQKGEFKEYPQVGFGAINYIKTNTTSYQFERDLKIQLDYDNYSNVEIDISDGIENTKITI
ncbi:hypothetical protein SAMN05443634_104103 [Chishuiella changwenlii]|jgi:hypothetical protein|uniref:Uncharacterized protein n=1 Tax=Chishuiella changwenlii TaxID=1434701 RepID=A0A1M6VZS9_9FLAO|nr:hypothetical protein [Chishuiella changwenlii]GGE89463.1 hypothetical protein GCM10010984_03880 [Chishuiella changwenlii]SHK86960.1 hypothetical protein SAMN05443634_104103 [Chishuiella changwenlii]